MTPNHVTLELKNISKEYAGGAGPVTVLQGINLTLSAGERIAIVGPSGSGKSTLLHIMGGLDRPTQGTVRLCNEEIQTLDEIQLSALRNRAIGFVFQAHYLLPHCTAWENVLLPFLANRKETTKEMEDRASYYLKRVGLQDRMGHRPSQLSGGEKQRVALVRALILKPRVLLADEPTGALDRKNAEELGALLAELNCEEGMTLAVVTHAMDLARKVGNVHELKDGKLMPL